MTAQIPHEQAATAICGQDPRSAGPARLPPGRHRSGLQHDPGARRCRQPFRRFRSRSSAGASWRSACCRSSCWRCGKSPACCAGNGRASRWPAFSACSSAAARSMSPAITTFGDQPRADHGAGAARRAAVFRWPRGQEIHWHGDPNHRHGGRRWPARLLIITKGQASIGTGLSTGDLLALLAMLGWAGYTLLQNRDRPAASASWRGSACSRRPARCSRCRLPIHEIWVDAVSRVHPVAPRSFISSQASSPACLPMRPMPVSARGSARYRRR